MIFPLFASSQSEGCQDCWEPDRDLVNAMTRANTLRNQGPEQRFRKLYRDHYPQVYAYFKRRTNLDAAEDGAVETFMVAWRRIGDVPGGEAALPWLYGVAHRILANQRRGLRRKVRLEQRLSGLGPDTEPTPEMLVVRGSEIQEVLDAFSRLRASDQEVLRLAEWEELPHRDIASALGCNPAAVDQRIHRALGRLEKEVQRGHYAAQRKGGAL